MVVVQAPAPESSEALARGPEAPTGLKLLASVRRWRGLWPTTACRRNPLQPPVFFSRLAAGWRQPHLPANPIKLRTETPTAASAGLTPWWKKTCIGIHTFLVSEKLPGRLLQAGHERGGRGGCFVATVLLTVCVNLLHYPLNPHLPEQNFTESVFSIKFATGSHSNSWFANISTLFSTSNLYYAFDITWCDFLWPIDQWQCLLREAIM